MNDELARRNIPGAVAAAGLDGCAGRAFAAPAHRNPDALQSEIDPKTADPGRVKPSLPAGSDGPPLPIAQRLADAGLTFHALLLDVSAVDHTLGIQRRNGSDAGFFVEGADLDLDRAAGLPGTSLHVENAFFAGVHDPGIAAQTGDSQVGYQPPPTPRQLRLSRAMVEQDLLDRRLTVELGITHPNQYDALGNCSSIDSRCRDLLHIGGGFTTPFFSAPGSDASNRPTPSTYVEGVGFAVSPGINDDTGYDLGTVIEPVFQYAIHPNSHWNPESPIKARDGLYLGGTSIVPIGVLAGIERNDP